MDPPYVEPRSRRPPQPLQQSSRSGQSQASDDHTLQNSRSYPTPKHLRLSGESSFFHSHNSRAQFNAPGGTQNINEGAGNQFPHSTFSAPVYFTQLPSERSERTRKILNSLKMSPYRDRKDRNAERVPGTCDWFTSHKLFREWQESKSSAMLWVSADPGCGKSVLAKYLVDSVLRTTKSRTTCYFFFKDDFEDQRNVVKALCCVLHQLFMQKSIILSDAMLDQIDGEGDMFTTSFGDLWQTLISAAQDKSAGEIVCIFDALDECEEQGRSQLAQNLCELYGAKKNFKLKFLITSRPYGIIRRNFQPLKIPGLPEIHLRGEGDMEMEKISQEIDVFIRAQVLEIGARLKLTRDEENFLLQKLMHIPHRTYLWVHLTLDLVESDIIIDKTRIHEATSQLPGTVDEAYNKILSKSRDSGEARKILHIVVAAARPLTLREMAVALALRANHRSYDDISLRPEERFREDVRDICGLFVTIIDSKFYLLHQTAKEFLVQDNRANTPDNIARSLEWKNSLWLRESHHILAEICIWYLLLTPFETHPFDQLGPQSQYNKNHIFLDYSAKHWATHLHASHTEIQDTMKDSILRLCDVNSGHCPAWFRIYWKSKKDFDPLGFTTLMLASYFGLEAVVRHLLKMKGIDLNARDSTFRRSALSWAAENGSDIVVKLLINSASIGRRYLKLPFGNGPEIDSACPYHWNPDDCISIT